MWLMMAQLRGVRRATASWKRSPSRSMPGRVSQTGRRLEPKQLRMQNSMVRGVTLPARARCFSLGDESAGSVGPDIGEKEDSKNGLPATPLKQPASHFG